MTSPSRSSASGATSRLNARRKARNTTGSVRTAGSSPSRMTSRMKSAGSAASAVAAVFSVAAADRSELDQDVQQRLLEIDRGASQTTIGGQKILDGSFGNAVFQVGADVGQTISVNLGTSSRYTAIGKTADYVGSGALYNSSAAIGTQGAGVTTTALTGSDLSISVGSGQAVAVGAGVVGPAGATAGQSATSAYAKAAAINGAGIGGLNAQADTTASFAWTTTTAASNYALTINGVSIQSAGTVGGLTGAQVATNINANSAGTGVTATFSGGNLVLNAADGRDIVIAQTAAAAGDGLGVSPAAPANNTANDALTFAAGTVTGTVVGSIRLIAAEQITVAGGDAAKIGYSAGSLSLGNSALNSVSVTTVANANTAITRVDSALTSVSTLRSSFGAIQNRFDSVIASLSTTSENLSASRSRVQDADFAQETANLSRSQILQQAGTAMVAQANQLPQGVLALLR